MSQPDEKSHREQGEANEATRAPYESPRLTVYGTVNDLTKGAGGTAADGGGNMTMA